MRRRASWSRAVADFQAKTSFQEIEATFKIIDEEFIIKSKNFRFELDELGIATGLTEAFMGVLSRQAEIDKFIAVQAAQGEGAFFTNLGGVLGGFAGSAFGGPIGGAIGGKLGKTIGALL